MTRMGGPRPLPKSSCFTTGFRRRGSGREKSESETVLHDDSCVDESVVLEVLFVCVCVCVRVEIFLPLLSGQNGEKTDLWSLLQSLKGVLSLGSCNPVFGGFIL